MLSIETKETAQEELYISHYYKTSYEKIKTTFLEYAEKNQMRIVSIDDNFGEIFVENGPRMSIQVKIIEQNPLETSIDFYINSEFLFGNKKKIALVLTDIYKILESNFTLKGLGLHA